MEKAEKHNISLDMIRILAIFMVLSVHAGQYVNENVKQYTGIGAKGVTLFFILSGYLAMESYQRISHNGNAIDYYKNRVKRILPQYYFILIFEYIVNLQLYHTYGYSYGEIFEPLNGICGLKYLRYFLFLHGVLPSNNYLWWNNGFALWTMSSFAFFYLIVPLLFRFIRNWKVSLFITIALLILRQSMVNLTVDIFKLFGAFNDPYSVALDEPINNICYFMIGITVWHLKDKRAVFGFGALAAVVAVFSSMTFYGYEMIFTALLIFAISFPINQYTPIAMKKVIRQLCSMSFFIYLSHMVFLPHVAHQIDKFSITGWLKYALMMIGIFLTCWVFFRIYKLIAYLISLAVKRVRPRVS